MAMLNLIMSPFVMVFVVSYFFLQNAEHFYRHPVSVGARQWSLYARWKMREFNELEDHLKRRLDGSHKAATKYVLQFPTPMTTQIAKFVAYIAGSFAATCLAVGVMSGPILEKPFLSGQNFIWYTAFFGLILAVSRSFIPEDPIPYKPEEYMEEVVENTHYFPRRWREKCHTKSVQSEFSFHFKLKVTIFFEEIASIFLTPFILFFSLPECAPRILDFIRDFTEDIEGVGHVCSLAMFDFEKHGNTKYGSQFQSEKRFRSRQGKMEKSFLTFSNYYGTTPSPAGKDFMDSINKHSINMNGGNNGLNPLSPQLSFNSTQLSELTEDQQNLVDLRSSQTLLQRCYKYTSSQL
jgi:autophagy-related protein 9